MSPLFLPQPARNLHRLVYLEQEVAPDDSDVLAVRSGLRSVPTSSFLFCLHFGSRHLSLRTNKCPVNVVSFLFTPAL